MLPCSVKQYYVRAYHLPYYLCVRYLQLLLLLLLLLLASAV